LELSWLEDFLALANTGNFSVSAAQRNMTQSAFSKRIRSLETWLGTELVDRRTFPASLTAAGDEFRDVARSTLNAINSERGRLQTTYSAEQPELRILGATTLLMLFAPQWLAELKQVCGNFSASLKTQNFYTMVQALVDREVDLVLQYAHPSLPSLYDKNRFHSLVLTHESFVPVSLAKNGIPVFKLGEMPSGGIPMLRYSRDGFLNRVEDLIFQRSKLDKRDCLQVLESPTSEVLKNCVLMGQGVAWLPYYTAKGGLEHGNLALAGGPEWVEELEVRAYGLKEQDSKLTARIWRHLEKTAKAPS